MGMSIHPLVPLSLQSDGQLSLSSSREIHPHLVGDIQLALVVHPTSDDFSFHLPTAVNKADLLQFSRFSGSSGKCQLLVVDCFVLADIVEMFWKEGIWVKVSKLRWQGDPVEAHPIPIAVGRTRHSDSSLTSR